MRFIRKKIIKYLLIIKKALAKESKETKNMLFIYGRYMRGDASKNDMKKANAQFRELLKNIGLGIIVMLPFAVITIPVIVKVGRFLGVDILPTSFKEQDKKNGSDL